MPIEVQFLDLDRGPRPEQVAGQLRSARTRCPSIIGHPHSVATWNRLTVDRAAPILHPATNGVPCAPNSQISTPKRSGPGSDIIPGGLPCRCQARPGRPLNIKGRELLEHIDPHANTAGPLIALDESEHFLLRHLNDKSRLPRVYETVVSDLDIVKLAAKPIREFSDQKSVDDRSTAVASSDGAALLLKFYDRRLRDFTFSRRRYRSHIDIVDICSREVIDRLFHLLIYSLRLAAVGEASLGDSTPRSPAAALVQCRVVVNGSAMGGRHLATYGSLQATLANRKRSARSGAGRSRCADPSPLADCRDRRGFASPTAATVTGCRLIPRPNA